MGFLQSILTPAGTNARQGQVDQQKQASQGASDALKWLGPLLSQQAQYSAGLEPGREADAKRLLYLASPGNTQARQDVFERRAASNAGLAAKEAGAAGADQGLSPAYTQGNNAAIANSAAQADNQNWQQMNSPEYQLGQSEALMKQYQNAMGLPSQSPYDSAASVVYGRPQVPVAPGIGQVFGAIAGKAGSDYLDNQMGGGS